MDSTNISNMPTVRRYGIIGATISIFLTMLATTFALVNFSMPESTNMRILQVVSFAVTVAVIVMAIIQQRDKVQGGLITFGKALSTGWWTTVVIGVITSLFTYLYFRVISPLEADSMAAYYKQRALEQGAPPESMDGPMMEFFLSPLWMAFGSLFGTLIMGFIISLIAAAVLKTTPPRA